MKSNIPPSRLFSKFLLVPLASLSMVLPASAVTRSWDGSSSTTWTTGANWTGDTAPANSIATDIAQFSTTTSGRMPNVAGTRSINGLIFDSRDWFLTNSTLSGVLSIGAGGINIQSQRTVTLETQTAVLNQSWTTTGSAILNVNNAVTELSSGPWTLTKAGTGTMNLNASVNVGTLALTGGYAVLGGSNLLGDSMSISGNAANLNLNNFSDSVGTLLIGADILALDFGTTPGANSFSLSDSSALSWGGGTLIVQNFEVGIDTLRFGTDSSGLTSGQLSQIQFGPDGPLGQIDSLGYVTAVPEPSTFALLGIVAAGFYILRRRRK